MLNSMSNNPVQDRSQSYMLNVDTIQIELRSPLETVEQVPWSPSEDVETPRDPAETELTHGDAARGGEHAKRGGPSIKSHIKTPLPTGVYLDVPQSSRSRSFVPSLPSLPDFQDDSQSWQPRGPHGYGMPQQESWEHCRKLASGYDSEMCGAWKAELDNLLIFAGLFSAAVTAFTIDSYKWLQPDSAEYNARVLALIYEELNPTTGTKKLSMISDPLPQGLVVRINIYWFLSLTLGLTTVLIGIIVAQWLREYQREIPLSSQGRLSLRQMRYEGLVFWQVPRIISFLPLFLQLGFVLFLVGILELLWNIDKSVAIAVTIPIGLVFLFLLATVALPAIQYLFPGDPHLRIPQCAYKSPQSLGTLRFIVSLSILLPQSWKNALRKYPTMARLFNSSYWWSWQQFDTYWRKLRDSEFSSLGIPLDINNSHDIVRSLNWLAATYDETSENILSILQCLQQLPFSSAVQVVSKTCSRLSPQALDEFNNLLHARSFSTKLRQDVMTVAFLCGYQRSHPLLQAPYWTSHVRLMKIKSIPRRLLDWCGADLSINELPHDLRMRLLRSLDEFVKHDLASPSDIQNVWQILHILLTSDPPELEASESLIAWSFKLFESLDIWLTCPGDLDLTSRVKLSMDGIRLLLYDGFFDTWGSYPGYDKLLAFALKLDGILRDPGGTANLLQIDKNSHLSFVGDTWPDYIRWIFPGV